ncbi:MAG: molybdopterin molybdotransferase MoeA [Deltaproteobacteria bacterium]|nr:molybdopterin molybdotransferase MoeA [Deltaproteobacteria bacterium]
MTKPFLKVHPPESARERLKRFSRLATEEVFLDDALFRVLSEPVAAEDDMPGFDRSTMDGFAVRSADTFGATESAPALLQVIGEVSMGQVSGTALAKGATMKIWTGGALPPNADAVVQVEHTQELDANTVEILKAAAPYEHVVRKGEDYHRDELLMDAGHRLRPQDLGLLAAMGRSRVTVYRKPAVGIMSSGDEIVPIEQEPPPGCVRDVNRHALTALVRQAYAVPQWIGIAPDELEQLSAMLASALEACDVVIVSGGSSMGIRDLVITAIEQSTDSEILLHGVSISPGKPLILARVGPKPVFGLPGHPISAMVCFEQFVVPSLRRLEGEDSVEPYLGVTALAFLSRNVASKEGRTDFVRVRLEERDGRLIALPILGKSGMTSAMVRAHGRITVAQDCEGLYKGDLVEVQLSANWIEARLEKKHLFGHEAARRSSGDLLEAAQQELLSGV